VHGPVPYFGRWTLSRAGLYHFTEEVLHSRRSRFTIWFFGFESGEQTELFRREGPFGSTFLAVSPDEKWVLYDETPYAHSELMLVENFH
jgi:hypothetical protein